MKYYKILIDNSIIGVATNREFRRYLRKNNILVVTNESDVEYIQLDQDLYHADWMLPMDDDDLPAEEADVIEITQKEYDALYSAKGIEDLLIPENYEEEEPEEEPTQIEVEYVRSMKILELSNTCRETIYAGRDVELSSGEVQHFSFTAEDQMNLQMLYQQAADEGKVLPYHADGGDCRFYSSADILRIYNAMCDCVLYNTTYFNSLKKYVGYLNDISVISNVTYGQKIPVEFQSEVMKSMR